MLKLCMPLPQKHVKRHVKQEFQKISLLEKCPNTEFWLVRIFVHSDRIQRFTEKISVFSLNAGKYVRTRRNSVFRHFSHSPCLFLHIHFADVITYFGRDIFSFLWSSQGSDKYKRITILQISYGNAPNKGPRVYIKFFDFWGVVCSRKCLL